MLVTERPHFPNLQYGKVTFLLYFMLYKAIDKFLIQGQTYILKFYFHLPMSQCKLRNKILYTFETKVEINSRSAHYFGLGGDDKISEFNLLCMFDYP
jgi:hypothetical protein